MRYCTLFIAVGQRGLEHLSHTHTHTHVRTPPPPPTHTHTHTNTLTIFCMLLPLFSEILFLRVSVTWRWSNWCCCWDSCFTQDARQFNLSWSQQQLLILILVTSLSNSSADCPSVISSAMIRNLPGYLDQGINR